VQRRGLAKLEKAGGRRIPRVQVAGIGRGTDAMRMADRPHQSYDDFVKYNMLPAKTPPRRALITRICGSMASAIPAFTPSAPGGWLPRSLQVRGRHGSAGEISFVELHDAYTSSEVQTYEDMGLCRYGEGGPFAASGKTFMPSVDYGLELPDKSVCPVNPSAA